MIRVVFLVIVMGLCTIGCLVDTEQPIGQPALEQSTTGTVQYDYKAGAPNDYKVSEQVGVGSPNPYLNAQPYPPMSSYYPEIYNPHHFDTFFGGGYYYVPHIPYVPPVVPVPPISVVFWSGSAVVTVTE